MSEQNQGIYQIPHANNGVFDDVENKNTLEVVYEAYNENTVSSEELKTSELRNPNFNHDVIDIALHQTNSENIVSFKKFKEEKQLNFEIDDIYSQNNYNSNEDKPSIELLKNIDKSEFVFYLNIMEIGPKVARARDNCLNGSIVPIGRIREMIDGKKSKKHRKVA